MSRVSKYTFRNMHLLFLSLSGNPLTFIGARAFDTLYHLQHLLLIGTKMEILPTSLIEQHDDLTIYFALAEEPPKLTGLEVGFAYALPYAGFLCWHEELEGHICAPCPPGTYHKILDTQLNTECVPCPPGGFYQDRMAHIGIISHGLGCKTCPSGRYVNPEAAPGKAEWECTGCPQGTDLGHHAGFRACPCLENFYRFDRFGGCIECPRRGLKCSNETVILAAGFYWKWKSNEHRLLYRNITENLNVFNNSYDRRYIKYNKSFPQVYACPLAESCLGGMKADCATGYEGPLCAVCSKGFYKMISSCQKCPSLPWLVTQISLVLVAIVVIFVPVALGKRVKDNNGRSLTDIVLARLKILIGFYQVTSGTLDSFSYIQWPSALTQLVKYAKIVQLNLLQIAPIHCFSNSVSVSSYTSLTLFTMIVVMTPLLAMFIYWVKKLCQRKRYDFQSEESIDVFQSLQEKCYRAVFLVLFLIYPAACTQILQILPPACHRICVDMKQKSCQSYLRSDYSLECYTSAYNKYVLVAYTMTAFVVGFPVLTLFLLWKYRYNAIKSCTPTENETRSEISAGLSFLYENYSDSCWFWEVLELLRKVILTSVLVMIGGESRTNLGTAAIISGFYAVLFASYQPISDRFEHWLQLVSLMATCANMNVGMLLKIPDQDISSGLGTEGDSTAITALLLLVNTVVTGMIVVRYCVSFGSVVRKLRQKTRCDFECCLLVTLMMNGASTDFSGLEQGDAFGSHVIQDETFQAPGVASSLDEMGMMDIEMHERENETKTAVSLSRDEKVVIAH
ncbi:uncharacterized protein LOC144642903 [Oculina patagonica]